MSPPGLSDTLPDTPRVSPALSTRQGRKASRVALVSWDDFEGGDSPCLSHVDDRCVTVTEELA